jgi:hypothetical protein
MRLIHGQVTDHSWQVHTQQKVPLLLLLLLAQVFLSHQPLSFATTVLLACALCIHSVLEGVALGAQLTMEVRMCFCGCAAMLEYIIQGLRYLQLSVAAFLC